MMNRMAGNIFRLFFYVKIGFFAAVSGVPEAQDIEYSLIIQKKKIFIGEKINFELRFRYPASYYLRLRSIQDPEIPGISGLKIAGPEVHEEMGATIRYRVFRWHGVCSPDSAGKLVIPALRAVYSVNFETYELYSKPDTIEVKKLPDTAIEIDAMGTFRHLVLSCEKTKMEAGTAQKVYLRIAGAACGEIKTPKLELPDGLKYYDSRRTFEKSAEETNSVCTFEYVVQAVTPGEYTLPAQEFVFFDPRAEKYVRLKSNALKLQVSAAGFNSRNLAAGVGMSQEGVLGSGTVGSDVAGVDSSDGEQDLGGESSVDPEELISKKIIECQKDKRSVAMPWWLFFGVLIIFSAPVILTGGAALIEWYMPASYRQRRYAFRGARKNINYAEKENNGARVYTILKSAIAQRYNKTDITDDIIEQKLRAGGCSPDEIARWKKFSENLLVPEYSRNYPLDNSQIFTQARYWITKFEQIL